MLYPQHLNQKLGRPWDQAGIDLAGIAGIFWLFPCEYLKSLKYLGLFYMYIEQYLAQKPEVLFALGMVETGWLKALFVKSTIFFIHILYMPHCLDLNCLHHQNSFPMNFEKCKILETLVIFLLNGLHHLNYVSCHLVTCRLLENSEILTPHILERNNPL